MVELTLIKRTTIYKYKDANSMKRFKHTVEYVTSIPVSMNFEVVWDYLFKSDVLKIMGFGLIGHRPNPDNVPLDEILTHNGNNIHLEADYMMGVYSFSFDTYLDTEEKYTLPDLIV